MNKEFAIKEKNLHDQQFQAATKLSEAERKARTLEAALDASKSELFNLKVKLDEENAAKQAELDMLVSDLDRANHATEHAQKECESLREQFALMREDLSQAPASAESNLEASIEAMSHSNLEQELSSKEREVQQLVEDVQRLQGGLFKLRESSEAKIGELEAEAEAARDQCEQVQLELRSRADYDEVKRELAIIKTTEFSGIMGDAHKPLEALLLEKNRILQDENTTLRTGSIQHALQCQQLQERLEAAESGQHESTELVRKLENDLMSMQAGGASSLQQRSAADGSPAANNGGSSNASHELIADALKGSTFAVDIDVDGDSQPQQQQQQQQQSANTESSMLVVVSSQRERFRLRNNELQADNYTLQQRLQQLQDELDAVRADNVKLFEKIKYLQSYSPSARVVVGDDLTAKRYSSQYEEGLDPFTSFSRKERQRKYQNLSPPEKITLGISRMILGSKIGRTVFFFYMLFMHFMLYVVLYKYAYVDDCKHHIADLCYKKFGAQMVAGDPPGGGN